MNLRAAARRAAKRHGIDPDIFVRQINAESGFNPNAVSPAGARGVAQIMPATARAWGVNPMDPVAALNAAARNMAKYIKNYGGWENALRAYNAGPGAIAASKNYAETNAYVKKILQGADPGRGAGGGGGRNRTRSRDGQPRDNIFDVLARLQATTWGGPSVTDQYAQRIGLPTDGIDQSGLPGTQGLSSQVDWNDLMQQNYQMLSRLRNANMRSQRAPAVAGLGGPSGGPGVGGAPSSKLKELFYDPMGGWKYGQSIGAIGGHGGHVHVASGPKRIIKLLKAAENKFGLTVREHPKWDQVDPVHTGGSYHYKRRAGDVSGDPRNMRRYVRWVLRKHGLRA